MSTSTATVTRGACEREPALPAWKAELNAKLEAHRQRRGLGSDLAQERGVEQRQESVADGRSSRAAAAGVAARVAERYAKAPSYSEVLAANAAAAAAAAEMAKAAAVAAEAHQIAHQAAHDLFTDLAERAIARERMHAGADQRAADEGTHAPAGFFIEAQATVEHPQPLPPRRPVPERVASASSSARAIVDAFAEAEVPPATGLPAKLIEFPRELIAARKARPRVAEGPLAETPLFDEIMPEPGGLRIFEVEGAGDPALEARLEASSYSMPEDVQPASLRYQEEPRDQGPSWEPEARRHRETAPGAQGPQWQPIRLGEHPSAESAATEQEMPQRRERPTETEIPLALHVASLGDRGMAALVDVAVVTAAFLLFVLVFASCTAHPPLDRTALACAGVIFAALLVFYEWLFLSYAGGTLGMRYAQVALCTFEDENPTRAMARRRLWATLLVTLPVGLGLVWAVFDEDALGWHDRMTRTYQRSYR